MRKMKGISGIWILSAAATLLGSCTAAFYSSTTGAYQDDMYVVHNRKAIADAARKKAEAEQAEAAARQAQIEALLAQAEAETVIDSALELDELDVNPYADILVEDYESAYARRLRGFSSPTYKMPSSYYNFRYSSDYFYATAYDPAFYNIIVMGDEVWVEPKTITMMFGGWGIPYYRYYWSSPYYDYWTWRTYAWYGWANPYYYHNPFYWDYYYWAWYPHYYHHPPHRPGYWPGHGPSRPNVAYRPSFSTGNASRFSGSNTTFRANNGGSRSSFSGATSSYRNSNSSGNRGTGTSTTFRRTNTGSSSSTGYRNSTTYSRPSQNSGYSTPSRPSSGGSGGSGSRGGGSTTSRGGR